MERKASIAAFETTSPQIDSRCMSVAFDQSSARQQSIPPPIQEWFRGQEHESPTDEVQQGIQYQVRNEPLPARDTQTNQNHKGQNKQA